VEEWIGRHETPEQAFLRLEAATPYRADTWRKRLSDSCHVGEGGTWRGWWAKSEIDFDDVDEFLAAAGLTHLWHTDLADLLDGLPVRTQHPRLRAPSIGRLERHRDRRTAPHSRT
jgi:hypothetical protein